MFSLTAFPLRQGAGGFWFPPLAGTGTLREPVPEWMSPSGDSRLTISHLCFDNEIYYERTISWSNWAMTCCCNCLKLYTNSFCLYQTCFIYACIFMILPYKRQGITNPHKRCFILQWRGQGRFLHLSPRWWVFTNTWPLGTYFIICTKYCSNVKTP